MNQEEARKLPVGLYSLVWAGEAKSVCSAMSLAVVGSFFNGDRWFCSTCPVSISESKVDGKVLDGESWELVELVEPIAVFLQITERTPSHNVLCVLPGGIEYRWGDNPVDKLAPLLMKSRVIKVDGLIDDSILIEPQEKATSEKIFDYLNQLKNCRTEALKRSALSKLTSEERFAIGYM